MVFNEDSRVKIPTLLHLTRLGYQYISLKNAVWDKQTNIFTDIFKESIASINPNIEAEEIERYYGELKIKLDNEDLGKAFYEELTGGTAVKLIDFENFDNNTFHVVTELTYKNGDEEFRPDIVLLINGMPLAFIEVKKPHNKEGMQAETKRMKTRFSNKKFHHFANITQLMVFSNNMEYDTDTLEQVNGAYYATAAYGKIHLNYFREKEDQDLGHLLLPENEALEDFILKDNNLDVIKQNIEFQTNKSSETPTNRISTSLFSRERLAFLLRYSIAYVKKENGVGFEKHVMRYPQIFATKAIEKYLDKGEKKGIIWHTQGSGKTALAYYNVKHLTDYFQKKNIVPKFYFIVDRLDLAEQAKNEFTARDLSVNVVQSRNEFAKEIKQNTAIHNKSGKAEITVVNIQKFKEDPDVVSPKDYDISIQRVYFLDEVHRSYNPKGSFLANLKESDQSAIKIGLTGTPLLGKDYNSRDLFGDYIHKYYYNDSIADGYTLRLMREEIETNYKIVLQQALDEVEILKGDVDKKYIFAHDKFVEPMLDYIVNDFESSRQVQNDNSIGAMVVCDSSNQAKQLFKIFNEKYADRTKKLSEPASPYANIAAEPQLSYHSKKQNEGKAKKAILILHDIETKEERKELVEDFKKGKYDIVFVYNMLLTGFNAPRLKKLYLARMVKSHNLLQTLTRVNRPYADFKYGFVVDFADISAEFKRTNERYFEELQEELGDEMEHYSALFKSEEEITTEIADIKELLFRYETQDAEVFSKQLEQVSEVKQLQTIKRTLGNAKELYNLIRLQGDYELLEKIDFQNLKQLYSVAASALENLNNKRKLEEGKDTENLLNIALEDILFKFTKIKEEELVIADELKDTLRKTREAFGNNFDTKDPKFVSLKEELERLFKSKKLNEVGQDDMRANIGTLRQIHEKIKELNRQNNLLRAKYSNDKKYTRIHKRITERGDISKRESAIFAALNDLKDKADETVLNQNQILDNEGYFSQFMNRLVIEQFVKENQLKLNGETARFINGLVVKEYINEFNGVSA